MEIRLHIGVHRTATRHLRNILQSNKELLENQGICLPDPTFAERGFATAIRCLKAGDPLDEVNAELMSALTQDREYRRIIMIDPNISGTLMRPVGKEYFYPRITTTVSRILAVLDGVPLRLFAGLRNPATFIPSCYGAGIRHNPQISFDKFVSEANILGLRWSDFLHRAQMKKADLGLTTWRHEDYPFMWRDVAQALTGIENREALVGSSAPANKGLSLRGAILMHEYLVENPTQTRAEFERVRNAFDQKFPSDFGFVDEMRWPEDLTKAMTEHYDDDWYYIERMENVEALQLPDYLKNSAS